MAISVLSSVGGFVLSMQLGSLWPVAVLVGGTWGLVVLSINR